MGGRLREIGKVVSNPKPANSDPYGEGWFVAIEPNNLDKDLKNLLNGDEAVDWLKREIKDKTDEEV